MFNHLKVPESWNSYFSKYPNGLTIMEALCDWVGQVDSMIDHINTVDEHIDYLNKNLEEFYLTFQENLSQEIIKTLQAWIEDGTLGEVISQLIEGRMVFQNIQALQAAPNVFKLGTVIELLGYYTAGDGAGHKRIISESDDGSGVAVGSKWANLIVEEQTLHLNHFKKDSDESKNLEVAFKYAKTKQIKKVVFEKNKTYILNWGVLVDFDVEIEGNGATFKAANNSELFHNQLRSENVQDVDYYSRKIFKDYHALIFITSKNVKIRNLTIDGNVYNQLDTINGVSWNYVGPTEGGGIRNYYKFLHGISVHHLQTDNVLELVNVEIKNSSWNNLCVNNRIEQTVTCELYMYDCRFGDAPHDSVSLHRTDFKNSTIRDCEFKNNFDHGLHVYFNVSNLNISNNTFDATKKGVNNIVPKTPNTIGVLLGHTDFATNVISNISVSNNFFSGSALSEFDKCIMFSSEVRNCLIEKNIFVFTKDAIQQNGVSTSFVSIKNNTAMNNSNNFFVGRPFGAIGQTSYNWATALSGSNAQTGVIFSGNTQNNGACLLGIEVNPSLTNAPNEADLIKFSYISKTQSSEIIGSFENEKRFFTRGAGLNVDRLKNISTSNIIREDNWIRNLELYYYDFNIGLDQNNFDVGGRYATTSTVTLNTITTNNSGLSNLPILNVNITNTNNVWEVVKFRTNHAKQVDSGIYRVQFYAKGSNTGMTCAFNDFGRTTTRQNFVLSPTEYKKFTFDFDTKTFGSFDSNVKSCGFELQSVNGGFISNFEIFDIKVYKLGHF